MWHVLMWLQLPMYVLEYVTWIRYHLEWLATWLHDSTPEWILLLAPSLTRPIPLLIITCMIVLIILSIIFGTRAIFRWPLMGFLVAIVATELSCYIGIRYTVLLLEQACCQFKSCQNARVRRQLQQAETYQEWKQLAKQLDEIEGRSSWKHHPDSRYYHSLLVQQLIHAMRDHRIRYEQTHDIQQLVALSATLATCTHKNVAGIMNENLYSKTLEGTKDLIQEFITCVIDTLHFVTDAAMEHSNEQPQHTHTHQQHEQKTQQDIGYSQTPERRVTRSSLRRAASSQAQPSSSSSSTRSTYPSSLSSPSCSTHRQAHIFSAQSSSSTSTFAEHDDIHTIVERCLVAAKQRFGATALCLSGGATLGNYHWGVVRALLDADFLPSIISGTSSGAVVASYVCTRTDEELRATLTPDIYKRLDSFGEPWIVKIKRFLTTGAMFDREIWHDKLKWFGRNMTFLEAFQHTGRHLNITATSHRKHAPPLILNHLTTPHVTVASAVLASSAVPGLIAPVVLYEKVVIDGQVVTRPYQTEQIQWRDGSFEHDLPMISLSELFQASFFIVSQTNPHIIPFFFNNRGQSGNPSPWRRRTGAWRGGFLLSTLELWLKEDMKKNLRVLAALDLLPKIMGQDWSYLFLQEFQGQITLVPHARFLNYFKLISDPTYEDEEEFLQEGKLTTWRKFCMIENRLSIASTLDTCLAKIQQTSVSQQIADTRGSRRSNGNGHGTKQTRYGHER